MTPRPINDYVLVDRYKASDFTSSGLYVPDKAKQLLCKGKVIAIGNGRRTKKTKQRMGIDGIKPGDEIVWVQQGVEKIKDSEGKKHIFVEEKYILAVIE